jgi:hypothetical protein
VIGGIAGSWGSMLAWGVPEGYGTWGLVWSYVRVRMQYV